MLFSCSLSFILFSDLTKRLSLTVKDSSLVDSLIGSFFGSDLTVFSPSMFVFDGSYMNLLTAKLPELVTLDPRIVDLRLLVSSSSFVFIASTLLPAFGITQHGDKLVIISAEVFITVF